MKKEGPDLTALIHHMETTPPEFLYQPQSEKSGDKGVIDTRALFLDLLRNISNREPTEDIPALNTQTINTLLMIQLTCRLFSYPWFIGKKELAEGVIKFIGNDLNSFVKYVQAKNVITNNDRREEFCRLALSACGLRPQGETETQALERFESVSTVKRKKILKKSAAAVKKVKAIRKKMEEEAAREAANVYGRE